MKITSSLLGLLIGGLLLAGGGCRSSAPEAARNDTAARAAIRALLQDQVEAWNRGDIEAFMAGYARTDSLRFASGGNVYRGWQAALDRYRTTYPDRAAMGTLAFDRLDVQVLAPRTALVFGAWRLTRAADAPNGLFTLLLKRRPEGWRIVHDHTSSADSG